MKDMKDVKKVVRASYAKIAKSGASCCPADSCCPGAASSEVISRSIGYGDEELKAAPEGANLGLGCGNPVAIASLKEGDVVLDLGCGAGLDVFLASRKVGPSGRVIGVDMTREMIEKAERNADLGGYANVEFRLGEIEKLPARDNSADAIISNCVINLSPDKEAVFREAFRVLKPGGRLLVSDLVLIKELPDSVLESMEAYVGCIAGAAMKDEYLGYIRSAGFQDVVVLGESKYPGMEEGDFNDLKEAVVSISVSAHKPPDYKGGNNED
jgi:arsenite methyltransferase